MKKADAVVLLRKGHNGMRAAIRLLTPRQMRSTMVTDKWSVKDVIAHLSAWNLAEAEAIDEILDNRIPSWWGRDETAFNRREVRRRAGWTAGKVIAEWEASFSTLIERMGGVSKIEWTRRVTKRSKDGLPVTVERIFSYRYRGKDHEGGHAEQINEAVIEMRK